MDNWYVFVMKNNDGSKSIAVDITRDSIEEGDRIVAIEPNLKLALETAEGFSKKLGIKMVNYND